MSWLRRFTNLFRRDGLHREIERELDFHVAERVDELVATGMREADARREARRRFGNPETVRERVHNADVIVWLDSLGDDLRYTLRALRTHPGFALVAMLSLGLGIGANTAIFSIIDAVMLRSLPVRAPHQLVQITMEDGNSSFTNPLWEEIRDQQATLAGTFAFSDATFDLSTGGVVRHTGGAWVSGSYFHTLGVGAARGRVLGAEDDVRGCPGVAVLSHGFWQREYGGSSDVIGRDISLEGNRFPIVGVAEPGFAGVNVGREAGVFVPLCALPPLSPGRDMLSARSFWFLNVFGRVRPGQTLTETRAGFAVLAPRVFEAAVPEHWTPEEQEEFRQHSLSAVRAANGLSNVRGQYREALWTLLLVVGVVQVIACANVGQLLLARASARQHEMAVRLAMGSGRARLVRQLLTESMLLAMSGAVLGVVFARWSSELLVRFLAQGSRAVVLDLSLDLRVLAFTLAVAIATGLLFGLAPAFRSVRVEPHVAIRRAGRGTVGDSRHRVAKGIVAGQVALSLVLVTAAGLLVGSFRRLATTDLGFRSEGVMIVSADWTALGLSSDARGTLPRELLERLRGVPGVRDAGAAMLTPIAGTSWNEEVVADDITTTVWFNGVTDGFLQTLGIRLIAGRDVTPLDDAGAPRVALLNQTAARRLFGDEIPLGRHIRTNVHDSLGPPVEIIGIVEDGKYQRVDEETFPTAYVPLEQGELWSQSVELVLRGDGAPAALIPPVTEAMRAFHPALAIEFTALEDQVANSLARPRLLATLSGFFGLLALALAVIGLYGTMSYAVARRRNEIGVRIALGAARRGILFMVAREAGGVISIGVALGLVVALLVTRLVGAFLYGVTASDPVTLTLSAALLATVALAAGLVPAWRAAGVDPTAALRQE